MQNKISVKLPWSFNITTALNIPKRYHVIILNMQCKFVFGRLRVLNCTKNKLSQLPPLNENSDLNKVQELYLTGNNLGDTAMEVISGYARLKVLHIAYNEIHELYNE